MTSSRSSWRVRDRGLPAWGPVLPASQQTNFQDGPAPLKSIQTMVLLNLYRNPQNTAQTADGSHWRDHFLGAGRTVLCSPPADSTLPPPSHVGDVEVQEHYDNLFEVTPKVPYLPLSQRKKLMTFPRPPAGPLLRS